MTKRYIFIVLICLFMAAIAIGTGFNKSSLIHAGNVTCIDGNNDIVYAGVGGSLNIYNIYRRDYPQLINSLDGLSSEIVDIALDADNNKLYLLAKKEGLFILDISEPYLPRVISHVPTGGENMISMDWNGDSLLFIGGENFVTEVNVREPENVRVQKSVNLPGTPIDVDYHNEKCYVAMGANGMCVLGTSQYSNFVYYGMQSGNYTLVEGYAENVLYGRLDEPKPDEAQLFRRIFNFPFFYPVTAQVVNEYIFTGGLNNFAIYEIRDDKKDPKMIWNLPDMPTLDSKVKDTYVYLANDYKGLSVFDITNVENPVEIGRINSYGRPEDMLLLKNELFVAAGRNGVQRFDISSKIHPYYTANLNTGDLVASYSVDEYLDIIYVLGTKNGDDANVYLLKIDQFSDEVIEEYPIVLSANPQNIMNIVISNDYCGICLGSDGIEIYRFENNDLIHTFTIETENQFFDLEFDGNYVYTSDFNGSYSVYELGDNVELVSSVTTSDDGGNGISLVGDYLLAADATSGIRVIDMNNPLTLSSINQYSTTWAMDIHIEENIAFLADGQGQCKVFDISNLPEITLIDSLHHNGYWTDIIVEDNYVFGLDTYHGIYIYEFNNSEPLARTNANDDIPVPGTTNLYQNYPNPFNSSTEITFTLSNKEYVDLSIFDISGKAIEVLIRETLPQGTYTLNWTPENVPSGVYLAVMKTNTETITKKIDFIE